MIQYYRYTRGRRLELGFSIFLSCVIAFLVINFVNINESLSKEINIDLPSQDDVFSSGSKKSCSDQKEVSLVHNYRKMVIDSIDDLWGSVDKDDNGHLAQEEIAENIKEALQYGIGSEKETNLTAKIFLEILDKNLDTVVTIYELRFVLYSLSYPDGEKYPSFLIRDNPEFIRWIKTFIGQTPCKIPLHLVKFYQIFDEDLNGKLTWKEVRMVIKMLQRFKRVPTFLQIPDRETEKLFNKMDNDGNKWLNMEEFSDVLISFGINVLNDKDPSQLYKWISDFLEENSEYASASESTCKEFEQLDMNPDGIISKGELIEILHNHRKDYYTEARINRRFSRSDRNADGKISFNEYVFLESLKNRKK